MGGKLVIFVYVFLYGNFSGNKIFKNLPPQAKNYTKFARRRRKCFKIARRRRNFFKIAKIKRYGGHPYAYNMLNFLTESAPRMLIDAMLTKKNMYSVALHLIGALYALHTLHFGPQIHVNLEKIVETISDIMRDGLLYM